MIEEVSILRKKREASSIDLRDHISLFLLVILFNLL
jgi:hypothetical protein